MRNIIIPLVFVMLASCGQHKKEIARMQAVQDSIALVNEQKDSTIIDFLGTMNEIQQNLDSIKSLENVVSMNTVSTTEPKDKVKKQIIEDVKVIHDLMIKNKSLIASLQKKLNYSGKKVKELQKMIDSMTKKMEEKDNEIATLSEELKKLNIDIAGLNEKITAISEDNEQKAKTIEENTMTIEAQTIALNTAFYAVGTYKELAESNVVDKEGGILGIGSTIKMKKDFNREAFTKVDIREINQIELNVGKVKVATTHPAGSYHLTGEKSVESLVIDDADQFWKASKYLIIVTN